MPLTEFQQLKLCKMFEVFDLNGDGKLKEEDFVRRSRAFARERGWTEESPEYREQMDFSLADWRNLQQAADTDDDGCVTRDEFLGYAALMLADPEALEQYAYHDAALIFKAMDADGDGRITIDEYRRYLRIYEVDDSAAHYFFEWMDTDRDGCITRDEIMRALSEFLLSEDLEAPGNFLFGPLDQRIDRARPQA
jgi:Ca2+-binding EF-hand superfamily protein